MEARERCCQVIVRGMPLLLQENESFRDKLKIGGDDR